MKIIRWLLFPLSQLYVLVTAIRNFMFDFGFYKQAEFSIPVISVGNLSTGGTGKTPFVECLADMMKKDKRVAVLSRGYGRDTRGFVLADAKATPRTIGDEPFQIFKKFEGEIIVAVCEKRKVGIEQLLGMKEKPEVILLDDAYQHRWVKRDLNILLTTYHQPFFRDLALPTGNLRETRFEAKRADMVVVTKCPESKSNQHEKYKRKIKRLAGDVEILFSHIQYKKVSPVFTSDKLRSSQVILLTGIANAEHFSREMKKTYKVVRHFEYTDHHSFSEKDLDELNVNLSENAFPIVTTEKDMVRLLAYKDHGLFRQHALYYLPISLAFDKPEALREHLLRVIS